ncbi:hypothetical protein LUZ60_005581 [Juncus effusus]|nr:hypothetical protein LUZ60_005581 [Juncus effusus]
MFLRSKIIMLRKRSRSVGNNRQSISTDTNNNTTSVSSLSSSNNNKPSSPSIFSYSRLFSGLSPKTSSTINGPETEHFSMSPTSTLESIIPFSKITNPPWFHSPNSPSTIRETKHKTPTKPIGLGLIDALKEEDSNCKTSISKLKIQVPPFSQSYPISPTTHHIEFGVKNKSSQLAFCSPIDKSPVGSNGCLSPRDIELLSEDYTCIISHGPNAKTTHIFDNRVVENPGTELGFTVPLRCDSDWISSGGDLSRRESDDFLSFCHACNKDLGHGSDIFIYRGERAFCSSECRYEEMLFDEVMD